MSTAAFVSSTSPGSVHEMVIPGPAPSGTVIIALLPSGSVTSNHATDAAFGAVFEQSPKWLRCDLEQPGATKVTLQGGGPA